MATFVLTDIEGTTSSIAFVKDVLFPYARERMPDWLAEHAEAPEVAAQLDAVRAEIGEADADVARLAEVLQGWIDDDRKATPLKALQGWIWREGFEAGAYRAHVYPDALDALARWQSQGLEQYVYSSGSVAAQVLFFRHSVAGDLTHLFEGHFDTTTGPKKDVNSYVAIAGALGTAPAEVLFLSDLEAEVDAAAAAGMPTVWVVRDGPLPSSSVHLVVRDLAAVDPTDL